MEKVLLPRGVAEAIETLRSMDFKVSNHDIIYAFANSKCGEYPELIDFANNNFDTLLKALVNGYEAEQTIEEKLFNAYSQDDDEDTSDDVFYNAAYNDGFKMALEIAGIKVKGVNA
jgi:hypothetical protein